MLAHQLASLFLRPSLSTSCSVHCRSTLSKRGGGNSTDHLRLSRRRNRRAGGLVASEVRQGESSIAERGEEEEEEEQERAISNFGVPTIMT